MSAVTELKTRTPAETQLLQLAEARGENENARRPAIEALRRDGLPTRKVEAWHYTDLRALMGRRIKDDTAVALLKGGDDAFLEPLLANSAVIHLDDPVSAHLPDGVMATSSSSVADWQASPNHLDRSIDTIRALSAAFGASSAKIAVSGRTSVETPIELRPAAGSDSHFYAQVSVGEGASATFVERLEGEGAAAPTTVQLSSRSAVGGDDGNFHSDHCRSRECALDRRSGKGCRGEPSRPAERDDRRGCGIPALPLECRRRARAL